MTKPIDELLKAASEKPTDVKAFFIVTVDSNGQCQINANGDMCALSFMLKSLDVFVTKIMSGGVIK